MDPEGGADMDFEQKYACAEEQRVGCAMGGIYTALAIGGVIPIMHSGPGCIHAISSVMSVANGGQNPVPFMESSVPSSNLSEAEVVFGATEKLRSVLEHSMRYYKAEIFMIATGCSAEIIGEDVEELTERMTSPEKTVLHVSLPGFKGNNVWGHAQVLNALVDGYVDEYGEEEVEPGRVNILGVVPFYDPMWCGTLEKLEQLLLKIGLKPNILYGRGKGTEELRRIPTAEYNLVLGPWVDLDLAKKLKRKYGTPFIHFPYMPIGPTAEAELVRKLAESFGLDTKMTEEVIRERYERYYYYFDRNLTWLFDMHNQRSLPREFFTNTSASAALSITKYLVCDLGLSPRKIFIPEDVPKKHQEGVRSLFVETAGEYLTEEDVIFTDDGGLFEQYLKDVDQTVRKSAVFGSIWDDIPAKKANMPFVSVGMPYGDVLVGDKNYFGTDGAVGFMSDLYNDCEKKGLVSAVV